MVPVTKKKAKKNPCAYTKKGGEKNQPLASAVLGVLHYLVLKSRDQKRGSRQGKILTNGRQGGTRRIELRNPGGPNHLSSAPLCARGRRKDLKAPGKTNKMRGERRF